MWFDQWSPFYDIEKTLAEMDAGVLTIHIPKAEKAKPKKIKIVAGQ